MIVAVKTNQRKRFFIKLGVALIIAIMLISYYFHMSEEFRRKEEEKQKEKLALMKKNEKKQKILKLERAIYKEVQRAVNLLGQKNVQDVQIIRNKALIVADSKTNLEAIQIRYGSAALIKEGIKDIKIAIDLKYILESKVNEK